MSRFALAHPRACTGGWSLAAALSALAAAALCTLAVPAAAQAPLAWPACLPDQVEVMILGTFHFAQTDEVDVLEPRRQTELARVLDGLERWAPDRIAVESAHAAQARLDSSYAAYRGRAEPDLGSANEVAQIGFRLARRLSHDRVFAADVPINLWDDSIQVFDDRWPASREGLRARWPLRYDGGEEPTAEMSIASILEILNEDAVPGNSDMYAGFLPLVEDEVYAGALKLRPWYDRNLRIVQNLFRIADPADGRLLLVIGSGHLRVLKQILELTPQLCPVSALPILRDAR